MILKYKFENMVDIPHNYPLLADIPLLVSKCSQPGYLGGPPHCSLGCALAATGGRDLDVATGTPSCHHEARGRQRHLGHEVDDEPDEWEGLM